MENKRDNGSKVTMKPFGRTPEGEEVMLYSIVNKNGMKVDVINHGGIIVRLFAPDSNGNMEDIVLGYDNLDDYIEDSPYFGALIGRFGNRIDNGEFTIDGKKYKVAKTNFNR
ncbi:MAG: hypothetical protein ACOCRZ_07705 [Halothermotrichaceae bacterium]